MSTVTDTVESVLEAAAHAVIERVVIAQAVAALPWLGYPVIGPVFSALVFWIAKPLIEENIKLTKILITKAEFSAERDAYTRAKLEFKVALESKPEKVKDAEAEFDRRLADLIHLRK